MQGTGASKCTRVLRTLHLFSHAARCLDFHHKALTLHSKTNPSSCTRIPKANHTASPWACRLPGLSQSPTPLKGYSQKYNRKNKPANRFPSLRTDIQNLTAAFELHLQPNSCPASITSPVYWHVTLITNMSLRVKIS